MLTQRSGAAIVLAALLGSACSGTPASAQLASGATARLLSDLSVLAHDSMSGRRVGTPGAQRARTFLVDALTDAGLTTSEASPLRPFSWPGGTGVNIVTELPGKSDSEDGEVIVLTAHYDHLGIRDGQIYNGADDNASGTAALLEIGRQLLVDPLEHPVVLAFVDAEEGGINGSRALVDDPPILLNRVALNVNLDMVARTDGVLWAGGAYHTPALRPILEDVARRAPLELRLGHDRPGAPEGDDWTEASDHASFHRVGIPFVYFGVEDHPDYHEPTDDFEKIDPAEFAAAVETILIALRALDTALPLATAGGR